MEFKIREEETFSFNRDGDIYVMRVNVGRINYIVIDTRVSRVGSIQAHSSSEAELMFFQITNRMLNYWKMKSAIEMLELAFSMNSTKVFMFLVNFLNIKVKFTDITQAQRCYNFISTPVNVDAIFDRKETEYKLFVTFPGHISSLGYFSAPTDEAPFTFYFNKDFI